MDFLHLCRQSPDVVPSVVGEPGWSRWFQLGSSGCGEARKRRPSQRFARSGTTLKILERTSTAWSRPRYPSSALPRWVPESVPRDTGANNVFACLHHEKRADQRAAAAPPPDSRAAITLASIRGAVNICRVWVCSQSSRGSELSALHPAHTPANPHRIQFETPSDALAGRLLHRPALFRVIVHGLLR